MLAGVLHGRLNVDAPSRSLWQAEE